MNRLKDKLEEIENYIFELKQFIPSNFEEYEINLEKKAACERYFEKIVEALIDLAYLITKYERFKIEEKNKIFDVLFEKEIISKNLCLKLKDAKGMRNVLSHKYGEIDDKIVFESISKELIPDSEEFLLTIKKEFKF
jgi:uncharacterized protein YutE (UPF0331/DUF86 family)